MKTLMDQPSLKLSFLGQKLDSTEFIRGKGLLPVRASTTGGPRHRRIQWSAQAMALAVFLLEQAAWLYSDRERAISEILQAVERDREHPETAPEFVGPPGGVVATLAEALKAKRSVAINAIFDDWLFVEDAFHQRISPPSVWLDVRHFSPLQITFLIDGVPVNNSKNLLDLAAEIRNVRWAHSSSTCEPLAV
jgi:hypothetical protein